MSDDHGKSGRNWLYAGLLSLFFLALLWSVDASIVYFLLAIAVFSFFQFFLKSYKSNRKEKPRQEYYHQSSTSTNNFSDLLRDLKRNFETADQNKKTIIRVVIAITSVFIFFTFIESLFSESESTPIQYTLARDFLDRGEYDSAAYFFRQAAIENPDDPEVYYFWGNTYMYQSRYDSAITLYDLALERNQYYGEAQYNKGYVLYQQKRYTEASDEALKILEYQDDDTNAQLLLGDCSYSQGQLEEALTWYNKAYEAGYRSGILCYLIAYIYDTQGQSDKAITLYKEALSLDSTYVDIYSRLGELIPGDEGNLYRTKAAQKNSGN